MRVLPMDGMQSLKIGPEDRERVYLRQRNGTMTLSESDARAAIREGVAIPANTAGPTAHLPGFTCPNGHRNFFRRCGRCESEN